MRRIGTLVAIAAVIAVLLAGAGCQKKIEVRAGTRVVCTYGEPVSDTVRTLTVPAEKAGAYRIESKTVTCERHRKLEALYAAAQGDITAGDLAGAKTKLMQVIASDSAFLQARQQLGEINAGRSPRPDSSPGGQVGSGAPKPITPTPKPGDEKPTGPVESMLKWAPDTVSGFSAVAPLVDPNSFSRQYVPQAGSEIVSLVIVAEQFRTPAVAKAAMAAQAERAYPSNSSRLDINGRQVYYGTDGRRFALLAFTQGAILVQVEMSGKPGQQATLKGPIVAVAEQMP